MSCRREPAKLSSRSHAANVDALIGGQALHADAIAEYGTAGEGAGRIDRHDPERFTLAPQFDRQLFDECALAGSRSPGDSDHLRLAGARKEQLQQSGAFRMAAFNGGDGTPDRAPVAAANPLHPALELLVTRHLSPAFRISRAITRR